jgi:hypothetical protein
MFRINPATNPAKIPINGFPNNKTRAADVIAPAKIGIFADTKQADPFGINYRIKIGIPTTNTKIKLCPKKLKSPSNLRDIPALNEVNNGLFSGFKFWFSDCIFILDILRFRVDFRALKRNNEHKNFSNLSLPKFYFLPES